jgi:expansin (peptidoglycan-binding protein)
MRQFFARFVHPLRLPFTLAVLVIAVMTSLPAKSHAGSRACEYYYYYDAAHTQYAGYCQGACYPGGAFCLDQQTEYYVRTGCYDCSNFPNN